MASPSDTPDLFGFLDYRAYLAAWFDAKKAANTRFSHRLFARLAGQKSPSLLLAVMRGKRNLTPATCAAFVEAMKLNKEESAFFRALVDLDQAETDDDRNEAWHRISAARRFREARRVEGDGFKYLSSWHYPAIRELAAAEDFREDPTWIAAALAPRITTAQARRALADLLEMGLLEPDEHGVPRPADATLVTPPQVRGLAVHNYHRQMSTRAHDAVAGFQPPERHLLGVTVGIPQAMVPQLKDELNAVQSRLLDLCDSAEDPAERVFQLNLQLFPLSRAVEDR